MSGTYGTLPQVIGENAKKQDHQVNYILNDADVLATMPFEPASHTLWNVYEELTEVSGGGFSNMNAPLPSIAVKTGLKKTDLAILGGKRFVPQDTVVAKMGSGDKAAAARYFAQQEPSILKKLGSDAEVSIIYNNLRAFALDNGKKLNAGASGNANYCLLAVRFEQGECGGLYATDSFKGREMVKTEALYDGALHENSEGVSGYGVQYKGYFGVQLANPNLVAGIFNITSSNKPTAAMVDDLLTMARAKKNTYLFCHPKVANILADVGKGGAYRMTPSDKSVDRRIADWNGAPIVTSYNFYDGTEAVVSFA